MKAEYKSKLNLENRVKLQEVIPLDTPFLIYADPSSLCNFRCEFCPTGHSDLVKCSGYRRQIMNMEVFKKLIDGLAEFPRPIKVLRMNKVGEPLINPDIVEMVRYAKNGLRVEKIDFATNAGLLDQNISEGLVKAGLDRLNVSIEGINNEQYHRYCGVTIEFEKIVEQIKYFYRIKGNCELVIKIPSNYISAQDIELFKDIFGDYCDRIFVENLTSIWPNFNIDKASDNIKISNESQYGEEVKDRQICSYIFYSMAVNSDGTVSACCPDWEQKLVIGDLHKNSIYEIWNSERLKLLQLQHLKGERNKNPICADCGHIRYCQVDDIDAYAHIILANMERKA